MTLIISILTILLALYVMSEVVDNYFLKSLDNIANWLKLPSSVAGATLLAFGTSAPEISTGLAALFFLEESNPGTAVGTIVGSAIFQMLVVIGFAAVVKTSYLNWKPVVRDSLFYFLSIALLITFISDGIFELYEAALLVGTYFVYLAFLFVWSRTVKEDDPDPIEMEEEQLAKSKTGFSKTLSYITYPVDKVLALIPDADKNPKTTIPVFILSLGIIGLSCYYMVGAAITLGTELKISETIIALTVLAGGTSVPELISSAIVSKQGRGDMAIANAIGSNIFDILMSLGLPVLIYTIINGDLTDFGGENVNSSVILLFFTLIAVVLLLAAQKFKASRWFGALLIFAYVVYVFLAYLGILAA